MPLNIGFDDILFNDFKDWAINTYTWKAPGNIGTKTFLVLQVVDKLRFYDISQNVALPLISSTMEVSLTELIVNSDLFKASGCSFSSGKGYLFVCGKGLEPCYVKYDPDTEQVSVQKLLLNIRDTTGIDDGLDNNTQPTSLSNEHLYNLINQGWLYGGELPIIGNSLVAVLKPTYIFRKEGDSNVTLYVYIRESLIWQGSPNELRNYFNLKSPEERRHLTVKMINDPDHYEKATCTFTVDSGYESDFVNTPIYIKTVVRYSDYLNGTWTRTYFSPTSIFSYANPTSSVGTPYGDYYNSQHKYPSNAQQWFVGRTVGQNINSAEVSKFDFGNKKAPRGRCILNVFTMDRSLYAPKVASEPEDTTRIIDTAFMGGRVFYLRQNQLLYSQVIEDIKQAGMCYTEGDPTSEDGFDVVDTDGGVITITDMGDAIALFELQNGLAVFAKNGVWLVTGLSSDEGFKATGYSVRKLSNLECISKNSIVNVQGAPLFWATSGIYVITQRDYVGYEIQSLSDTTIQSRYVEIPKHNLKNVKGLYNAGAQRVAWFYDDTSESSEAEKERETKALIYDVRLQAFYELDMDKEEGHPFLCAAFNTPYLSFVSLDDEVYDNNEDLVYDNDEQIIYTQEAIKNTDLTDVKYLAFEKLLMPAGPQLLFKNSWYVRDTSEDQQQDYAWKDPVTNTLLFTFNVDEPTASLDTAVGRYYRVPDEDIGGKYAWERANLPGQFCYTDSETPSIGDTLYTKRVSEASWKCSNGSWYERMESLDRPNDSYGLKYAFRTSLGTPSVIYTAYLAPVQNFLRLTPDLLNPQVDPDPFFPQDIEQTLPTNRWVRRYPSYLSIYAVDDPITVGTNLFSRDPIFGDMMDQGEVYQINDNKSVEAFSYSGDTRTYVGLTTDYDAGGNITWIVWPYPVTAVYEPYALPLYKKLSTGVYVYVGTGAGYRDGYLEPTNVVRLTSCNFDDVSFQNWGSIDYTSTFTTGANTCGDSFAVKDIVYLTTQLSRTEAVNLQGNVGNESSCLMQMKWDFEDNDYSHKWTTPVQIYRARRLFAPSLDDPHFDDISIRMPVITTKHKVRGDGHALQIKFSSESGKNFEVLGWNLVIGARQ